MALELGLFCVGVGVAVTSLRIWAAYNRFEKERLRSASSRRKQIL